MFTFKLFDVKFLFSENHVFWKQKRTACLWSYGRVSIVSDFKLTRENDDLFFKIFEVPHPVQEHTKMRIPGKRYRTNTVRTFWDTQSTSALRYLVLTISVGSVRKFVKYKWDYGIRNFSMLDNLVRYCICSQHGVFPLYWWYFPVRMKKFRQLGKLVLYYYEKKW